MSDRASSSDEAGPSLQPTSAGKAPQRHLPRTTFTAVEYLGPVSRPSALLKVITQDDINQCFNAPAGTTGVQLEMRYRMGDRAGVPVRGTRVPTSKLLLKIKRRRRKGAESDAEDGAEGSGKGKGREQGVFVAEIVGSVAQTVRFRQMADYHYTPNPEGRVSSMVTALQDLDYDAILDYSIPQLDEEYVEPVEPPLGEDATADFIPFRSRSDLQPPPLFSQRFIAPNYGYKNHPQTVLETIVDPYTGETRQRFVNKARNAVAGPQRIGHGHANGEVPKEALKAVKDKIPKLNAPLLEKLRLVGDHPSKPDLKIFEKRPVWLRHGLIAQLTQQEERLIANDKAYLAANCYILGAGPFWKCYIRFGYDPVYDPESYIYQRIYFYVAVTRSKTTMLRAQSVESAEPEDEEEEKGADWWKAEQERRIVAGERGPLDRTKAHLFDGQEIHRGKPDFQLCDITDPLIRKYIDDANLRTATCDDGWYKPVAMAAIRNLTKIKYVYVREHGQSAPNELCYDEIERLERGLRGSGAGGPEGEEDSENGHEDADMGE